LLKFLPFPDSTEAAQFCIRSYGVEGMRNNIFFLSVSVMR
jgi:hypothetical protein